ncbi:MAG: metalloregulator ArsR/SmtB family transcription factor [Pseudomonadota bacterium]
MDDVFKALADPTRRRILDLLRAEDGRTVGALETALAADMTRFGVMRHLGVLEDAGLITTRKVGRYRHVHLNVMPLQQVMDRWMDPMLRPWSRRLADLKADLEDETMTVMEKPVAGTTFRMETYIRTTPARLWQALTDPADTANYYFGSAVRSGWAPGDPLEYVLPDGRVMVGGEIVEVVPEKRLVTIFVPHFSEEAAATRSRVTYEIEAQGEVVKLTLTHENVLEVFKGVREGWPKILAGLKSLLETGAPLPLEG